MFYKFFYRFRHIIVCLIFVISFFSARGLAAFAHSHAKPSQLTIVIDAGHGGADPGKVGINGALEKDINLALALKLQKLFENKGFNVIMTRTTDCDLADSDSSSRKSSDLCNRIKLIEDSNASLTVSLHQNSFPDETVCGPQVFYFSESNESKSIAEIVQGQLDENLRTEKSRGIKANSDYYLLKKSPTPTVIVECGFLSNPAEANNLLDESYQDRLIRSVYLGICNYIKNNY